MKEYKIGEVAKLLGLTTQALRFYEQEGVIVPNKSENGTRYFTAADIVRLLAFKKYRLSEFSVQDVAHHFKQGCLDSLMSQLDRQSDLLIEQSEMLLRRARAIRSFERTLREAQALEGKMEYTTRPAMFLHQTHFDELDRLDEAQKNSFIEFMYAMPDTSMCFKYDVKQKQPPEFRFGVCGEDAEKWKLSLDKTVYIPQCPCVRIYVRADVYPWDPQYLDEIMKRVCAEGYRINMNEPVLGRHLASETICREVFLFSVLYIPVIPE